MTKGIADERERGGDDKGQSASCRKERISTLLETTRIICVSRILPVQRVNFWLFLRSYTYLRSKGTVWYFM